MLSDISIRRPVLATVFCLLIIAFGAISFTQLPLRELPDVDRPIVSIDVTYRGASAEVVETQVTQIIEDQLSGIESIDLIRSASRDGRSSINIEFALSRDLEDAANDVRNAVARAQGDLPPDVDPPRVEKTDADADPIMWLNLQSSTLDGLALTDYAERYLVDRLGVIDGVASVRVGGSLRPSLRIWLDPDALAARGLTPDDVEQALRSQNIELPAGYVESQLRNYALRVERPFQTPEEFARMAIRPRGDGPVVRLGDVARVEIAPEEERRLFRGNGVNQIGLGIVRQSKANALRVGEAVKAEVAALQPTLPPGTEMVVAFDSTIFIEKAIGKVYQTLIEALLLVCVVIFLFLGSFRAALIPAAVIPVCLVGAFALLFALGYSINLLTLMALVLSIGLVVDDSIVVLENAQRRVDTLGEPAPVAALRGTRQVFFAVIATSAVLVAVFTPFLFVGSFIGRLFVELAVTVAGVVLISAFAALSLTPMMCSKMLKPVGEGSWLTRVISGGLDAMRRSYRASLELALKAKVVVLALFFVVAGAGVWMFLELPSELTPPEDRGNFVMRMEAPEGSGWPYAERVMGEAEKVLLEYLESGEAERILVVAPGFGDQGTVRFNSGIGRVFLADWAERERSGQEILEEMNQRLGQIPGAVFRVGMQSPFSGGRGGGGGDFSIVLGGSDYATLGAVADRLIERASVEMPGLLRPRHDFEPNNPRVLVAVDRERAGQLGISTQAVGRALESTMGARRVTTIADGGEEYDVFIQAERDQRSEIVDLTNRYVRSDRTGELIPLASVVTFETVGDSAERRRVNRLAAVQINASLATGTSMGEALEWMQAAVREETQGQAVNLDYAGTTREFVNSTGAIGFVFAFALIIVFLVLAAQFESWVHPFVIMLTVPLAISGGLLGLYVMGLSLNIYSQIGLVILIALASKNGILIVEFANQLRDKGLKVRDAILEASDLRLRPVLMTSVATVIGAVPLVISSGAGAESRQTIGVVIFYGVTVATLLTLFIVPLMYDILARFTRSPEAVARDIEAYEAAEGHARPAE